jgi:hypothetical protein
MQRLEASGAVRPPIRVVRLQRVKQIERHQYGELYLVNRPEAKQRFELGIEYKCQWSVCNHEVNCNRLFSEAVNCYVFISSAWKIDGITLTGKKQR